MSLRSIIVHYRQHGLLRHQAEIDWFSGQPGIVEAIRNAATCRDERGKRYSHQNRLKSTVLTNATKRLLQAQAAIQHCRSFDELHTLVASKVGDISGIVELYVYDVSLRIGAYNHKKPEFVYLHAGTRKGARHFARVTGRTYLAMREFPEELQALKPEHVEDILCIYKERLLEVPNNAEEPTVAAVKRSRSVCG